MLTAITTTCIHSTTECINRFVTVDIDPAASVLTCLFQNNHSSIETTCSVEYGKCDQEQVFKNEGNSTLESPYRVTLQLRLPSGSDCYMYTVTASDGVSTVVVVGKIGSGKYSKKKSLYNH